MPRSFDIAAGYDSSVETVLEAFADARYWPARLAGGIGSLGALVDRDQRFLHDRLAGTRLIKVD